jgi:hypothetical protein
MCGRYALFESISNQDLAELVGLDEIDHHGPTMPHEPQFEPRRNIARTQRAPIVRTDANGKTSLDVLRWGLVPRTSAASPRSRSGRPPSRSRRDGVPGPGSRRRCRSWGRRSRRSSRSTRGAPSSRRRRTPRVRERREAWWRAHRDGNCASGRVRLTTAIVGSWLRPRRSESSGSPG